MTRSPQANAVPPRAALPEELSFSADNSTWLVRRDGTSELLAEHRYRTAADGTLRMVWAIGGVEWSPDGLRLLAFRGGRAPGLVVVAEDGAISERVVPRASIGSWSPDGTRIAFIRGEPGERAVLSVASGIGADVQRIAGETQLDDPSWSPSGTLLAYAGRGSSGLFIADASGRGEPVRVVARGVSHPRWSPDGLLIAFHSDGDVYVVRPNGTGLKRIAAGQLAEWAPDSRLVAFFGVTPTDWSTISVVRPNGTGLRRVARCECSLRGPGFWPSLSWSSDGSRIAFVSGRGDTINTVRPDGSGATRVATVPDSLPLLPMWRPARGG